MSNSKARSSAVGPITSFDYYDALGISRNASDVDIKRAYRKLSLKYHPDTDQSEAAKQEFCKVSEAYDVLSDPKKKGLFDLYGEEAVKKGVPDGKGGTRGGGYDFDPETTPVEVFKRFFGTNNPFEALNVIAAQFEALTTKDKPKTGKHKEYTVELSLEEIYHGCSKKVTHIRKTLYESGRIQDEERTLVIDAKPGLPDGTRFVFEGEGNKTPTKLPGPVVFVLKTKPHDRFVRKGADLVHKVVLPLYQSLVGSSVTVQTLDDRSLVVPLTEIVTPGYKLTVPGEGLPKPTGGKGNLTLEVELLFPTSVNETQRALLKAAFFLPSTISPQQAKALKGFETAFKDPLHGWATGFVKEEQ